MGSLLYCPTRGKVRHRTEADAAAFAEEQLARHGVEFEPYLCPCAGWHIATAAKRRATRERMERAREIRDELKGPPSRPFHDWEDALIWGDDFTRAQLAEMLGRSVSAIRARRRRLRDQA